MRLTRRGRLVIFLAVLAGALAVLVVLSGPALSIGTARHQPTRTVVVRPGETLWEIASRIEPGVDPRDVIAQIADMNSLPDGGMIRVGQPLLVPAP